MGNSVILDEQIGADLPPVRSGGITLYPANQLPKIFDWAASHGRSIEWVEGAFYDPEEQRGQHSLSYMRECGPDYVAFKTLCLKLVPEIEAEAAAVGLKAYFEIGITPSWSGS